MRICVVRMQDEIDSIERWCSSNAPWRAKTPIVIDSVLMGGMDRRFSDAKSGYQFGRCTCDGE